MSFICKKCHSEAERKKNEEASESHTWENHILPGTNIGISVGRCEDCKSSGETVDCRTY